MPRYKLDVILCMPQKIERIGFPVISERPFRNERVLVSTFLLGMCLVLAHFVHNGWFGASLKVNHTVPVRYAPDAYRVAIPAFIAFLKTFHTVNRPAVYTVLDFCFAFVALFLLYRVAVDDLAPAVDLRERFLIIAMFLALLQFPMAWIVPWQRPETMPSALYIAVGLFCVSRARQNNKWFALLLAATILQAFARSDVPFVFGVAIVLLSFGGEAVRPFGSRLTGLLKGGCIVLAAAAVQLYLQCIRFPHLTYPPDAPAAQWRNNLQVHNLSVLTISLFPFLLLGVFLLYKRPALRPVDALAVAAAALYLPLWFALGSVAEVRIFVPFMLALCGVAARVFSKALACGGNTGAYPSIDSD